MVCALVFLGQFFNKLSNILESLHCIDYECEVAILSIRIELHSYAEQQKPKGRKMKIIHVTDMHFGPYHWSAHNDALLKRINAFDADIVINTGDMTTDSSEDEFQQAHDFLKEIQCNNIVSILGNHDKFSKRSHEYFRKYIYDGKFIEPNQERIKKPDFYLTKENVSIDNILYDTNFVRSFNINDKKVLFLALDTCVLNKHYGFMEEEVLYSMSEIIKATPHDLILMCTHHSILASDNHPLINSKRITDFVLEHNVKANFCGHTHEMDIVEVRDLVNGGSYRQFMCSTMSGSMTEREDNMYCTYENFGEPNEKITIIRMYPEGQNIRFEETHI